MSVHNLLIKWYQTNFTVSSPLNLKATVDRKIIDFIYGELLKVFSLDDFEVQSVNDKAMDKVSWINYLLANDNKVGCVFALYEVCQLLNYAETLDSSIKNEMKGLSRSPQIFRTYIFELYVYFILDYLKIPNEKKPLSGTQILEGTCIINNREFLFECRKVFMYNIQELDILMRLMNCFIRQRTKMRQLVGMICTIDIKGKVENKHYAIFKNNIEAFFKNFNSHPIMISNIHPVVIDDEYGTFKIVDFDEASFIEAKSVVQHHIVFAIIPPKIVVPGDALGYNAFVTCHFSTRDSDRKRKLKELLKKKKHQHKNSSIKHKIIFLDSESVPEIQMGMFYHPDMFKLEELEQAVNELHMKEIVCVVRRDYMGDKPQVKVEVVCLPEYEAIGRFIKNNFRSITELQKQKMQ